MTSRDKIIKLLFNKQYRNDMFKEYIYDRVISDKKFIINRYKEKTGKDIDLINPKELNEKLQWILLFYRDKRYTELADKLLVKDYIAKTIGDEYNVKTLGVWNKFDDIDFNKLPEKFALKTNHDCGTHYICTNKKEIDYSKLKTYFDTNMRKNYYYLAREWQYKDIKRKIFAEEILENRDGSPLADYKFYCFDGEPRYFMYSLGEVDHNTIKHKFDINCKSIDYLFYEKEQISSKDINLPRNMNEMIELVRKLCVGFPYVRIDLYNIDGKIYFGEFTMSPNSGYLNIYSKEYSNYLASLIDIDKLKNEIKKL